MYNFNPNWLIVLYHPMCAMGGYNSFNQSANVALCMGSASLKCFKRIGKDAAR